MQKIGEILVSKGYVTQQQLDGVMAVKGDDVQVGQVLIQWGLLTEQQLMEALDGRLLKILNQLFVLENLGIYQCQEFLRLLELMI